MIVALPVLLKSQQIIVTPDTSKLQPRRFDFNLPERLERLPDTLNFNPGDTIPYLLWKKFPKESKDSLIKHFKSPVDQMPVIVPPNYNFSMIVVKPDSTVEYYIKNLHSGKSGKILPNVKTVPDKLLVPREQFKPKQ
ncbi:MAG: hypothetical protein PHV53_02420 [Fermentimonas sp.]|nr:hypothetical protein [Fermentimonas sp.]